LVPVIQEEDEVLYDTNSKDSAEKNKKNKKSIVVKDKSLDRLNLDLKFPKTNKNELRLPSLDKNTLPIIKNLNP
jgi:hypothetical protein